MGHILSGSVLEPRTLLLLSMWSEASSIGIIWDLLDLQNLRPYPRTTESEPTLEQYPLVIHIPIKGEG